MPRYKVTYSFSAVRTAWFVADDDETARHDALDAADKDISEARLAQGSSWFRTVDVIPEVDEDSIMDVRNHNDESVAVEE